MKLATVLGLVVAVGAATAAGVSGCIEDLRSLAPFPCGSAGDCPTNFTCLSGQCFALCDSVLGCSGDQRCVPVAPPDSAGICYPTCGSGCPAKTSCQSGLCQPSGTPTTSVTITPATATLAPGQTQQFMADVAVTWSVADAGGGSIDANGLYTAPDMPGTFHVVATASDGSTGMATVMVSAMALSLVAGQPDDGRTDDTGTLARFDLPQVVVSDGHGNLYVGDSLNNTIRKISLSTAAVTTFAGRAGMFGGTDGPLASATFGIISALVVDAAAAHLYVLEAYPGRIRAIDLGTGNISTLAGGTTTGSADGTGSAASFNAPQGMAFDGTNLYVADQQSCTVRRVTLAGVVTTIAGSAGQCTQLLNGTGTAARFGQLNDIAYDGTGSLYVLDVSTPSGVAIRKIVLSTLAVSTFTGPRSGDTDGTGANVAFNWPRGLTSDGNNLYVADGNNAIRQVTLANATSTTIAGPAGVVGDQGYMGFVDGSGTAVRFAQPMHLSVDAATNAIYVADSLNFAIRKLDRATSAVTTLAGSSSRGSVDGTGAGAGFNAPLGIAVDPTGTYAFVADSESSVIRKITLATRAVTTLAGVAGSPGSADGVSARFSIPTGIVADATGVYVSDASYAGGMTIRRVDIATGSASTIAGTAGQSGTTDGTGTAARFNQPAGLALDGAGNLYVADHNGCTIRKLVLSNMAVTTLAGAANACITSDGTGTSARLSHPWGLAWTNAPAPSLLVTQDDAVVRKIDMASGAVTTLAGTSNMTGGGDGTGVLARFSVNLRGIVTDGNGAVYVADPYNSKIRKIDLTTTKVTTVVGNGTPMVQPGLLPGSMNHPSGLALLPSGEMLIADEFENLILKAGGF